MTEDTPTLRSFVAVSLPGTVQTEIAAVAAELGRELPGVKWTKKPENLHVTIKFLGPVAADRLDALSAALGDALEGLAPFRFAVQGFGAFPSLGRAKVVFAGIEGARRQLTELADLVEAVAARFGFGREQRAFTAHVTVGRSKEGVDARGALARFEGRAFGEVDVHEAHVYESRLGQLDGEGSTYVLRSRAVLGAKN